MGFDLVQVRLLGQTRRTLQVMAEPQDHTRALSIDDCVEISRTLSALLDVHDPIPGAYTLEVSSPGIDRPLVRRVDYERFAGHLARFEVEPAVDGRKRFKGKIKELAGDDLLIDQDGTVVRLPYSNVKKAQLLLTDELIAASPQPAQEAAQLDATGEI